LNLTQSDEQVFAESGSGYLIRMTCLVMSKKANKEDNEDV